MAHIPINHPLQPVHRTLALLIGVFLIVFGIVGVTRSTGHGFFASHEDITALGLRTNMAFSVLSIVAGAVIAVAAIYGRNVDHWVNMIGGVMFLGAGMVMLVLQRTQGNILNFTVRTCVVSFIFGMVLLAAGLYGKTADDEAAAAEEAYRHGARAT
jgi:Domain of unknown function (DUF4383)